MALLALLLGAASVGATTYVLPSDAALVEQADVVAQVTVAAVEPAPISGPPSTDYFVQIESVLKGYVAGGTVVVRVPGGIGPDGVGLRIWGAPGFREGERLLLFLSPRRDGTYGLLHLMLGAFHERQAGEGRVAVRALSEAAELSLRPADPLEGVEPMRDFARFAEWIGEVAGGRSRPADYLLPGLAAVRARPEAPELLRDSCTNLGLRWFEFDRGEEIGFAVHQSGFNGTGAGRRFFERARRAWVRQSGLELGLGRSGRTDSSAGLTAHDGLNSVLFEDPNDLVSGAYSCRDGGLVSLTGVWFENGRGQACERIGAGRKGEFKGRSYLEIVEADIVANDGARCLLGGGSGIVGQVLAHELGHALGLGHGGPPGSLMSGDLDEAEDPASAPGSAERQAVARLYLLRPHQEP